MKDNASSSLKKENLKKASKRLTTIIAVAILALSVLLLGGLGVLAKQYEERVVPTLYIGDVPVGGAISEEVRAFLEEMRVKQQKNGVAVTAELPKGGLAEFKVYPSITLDPDIETEEIINFGKRGTFVARGWQTLMSYFVDFNVKLSTVGVNETELNNEIKKHLAAYETLPRDAKLRVNDLQPLTYEVTTSSPGVMFNLDGLAKQVEEQLSELSLSSIRVTATVEKPRVTEADVTAHLTKLPAIFSAGPITLTHYDSNFKRSYTWKITTRLLADWLTVSGAPDSKFSLDESSVSSYFSSVITPKINVSPQNAKFVLDESGKKIAEFLPSRPGITLDIAATRQILQDVVASRADGQIATSTLKIIVAKVEPDIATEQTNTLGIKEVLGVGMSNFSGSPRNRILNIKNAVRNKLHGVLVAPEEEFSLVNTLKPYTLDGGYLPELVIIGNRIKPEIAGGLCQVGTTMFRATMNSGLPVTARTNHGLVVSYYNDQSNGNPGTDATIYEPWPDFRFRNDTGHYVMITTEMNTGTGELAFTIWGTPDGRRGYYTAPKVLQWIPAGESKTIETKSLPPGKKECQGIHNGAVAIFNYIRELVSGEKITREFKSTYRAVPATCYIGVEKLSNCPEGATECSPEPADNGELSESDSLSEGTAKPEEKANNSSEEPVSPAPVDGVSDLVDVPVAIE